MNANADARWLLALESSTPHGGSALLKEGSTRAVYRLEEGLRHGRELMASAETLMEADGLKARDLFAVAVSMGPGSYTGIRVGVMAAKAVAYAAGCKLAAVSSLAALAQSAVMEGKAQSGDVVFAVQDARRDEVYVGQYAIEDGLAVAMVPDAALTPEETAARIRDFDAQAGKPALRAGSSFVTYGSVLGETRCHDGRVDPAAVGILGWRQILLEKTADPMELQPVYARRDADADWRHDALIQGTR